MAIKKFILTETHIKLIKQLKFSLTDTKHIISVRKHENDVAEEHNAISSPFGGDDIYEDFMIITKGKLDNSESSFDLLKTQELYSISEEQKKEIDIIIKELPTALEIVLSTQSFEYGEYKMKLHEGFWYKK